ncbi:MAG: hypothetical protein LUI85_02230 [Bacteroides sp.]|nr:hypothetical protein [Bacteroides sp.]
MKTIILTICSALLFCCCSSEKEEIESPVDNEIPTHQYYQLIGEAIRISLDLDTNGYSIKNNNPKALSCEYLNDKKVILMTSLKEGESSIHIINTKGTVAEIFKVSASYWESNNIEICDEDSHEKKKAIVQANNLKVKQAIEKQLTEYLHKRESTQYSFDAKTRRFTMNNAQMGEKYEGTYVWNIDSLILSHNRITERCGFQSTYKGMRLIIRYDRTKEYQSLYPDGDITSVIIQEIWRNRNFLGPIGGLVIN